MNEHPLQTLQTFRPAKEFLIGIGPSGCGLGKMELKHPGKRMACFLHTTICKAGTGTAANSPAEPIPVLL